MKIIRPDNILFGFGDGKNNNRYAFPARVGLNLRQNFLPVLFG